MNGPILTKRKMYNGALPFLARSLESNSNMNQCSTSIKIRFHTKTNCKEKYHSNHNQPMAAIIRNNWLGGNKIHLILILSCIVLYNWCMPKDYFDVKEWYWAVNIIVCPFSCAMWYFNHVCLTKTWFAWKLLERSRHRCEKPFFTCSL